MPFKGIYSLFLNDSLFGIIHGDPAEEGSVGILVASEAGFSASVVAEGPVKGRGDGATQSITAGQSYLHSGPLWSSGWKKRLKAAALGGAVMLSTSSAEHTVCFPGPRSSS